MAGGKEISKKKNAMKKSGILKSTSTAKSGNQIALNPDTGFLKVIAMVSMLMDHSGKMLFSQQPWMRMAGRLAFPIYAYCIAVGCIYTRNPWKYALRVALLALVSQPIYCQALSHVTPAMNNAIAGGLTFQSGFIWYVESLKTANILFTLLAGILLITCIRERRYVLAAFVTLLCVLTMNYLNYGWRGIVLMLLFYAFAGQTLPSICWAGGFMVWWALQSGGYNLGPIKFGLQGYALFALPLIYVRTNTGIRPSKWVFYLFYPFHLILIYLCVRYKLF